MSQKTVQLLIGRILTDEELRREFVHDPRDERAGERRQQFVERVHVPHGGGHGVERRAQACLFFFAAFAPARTGSTALTTLPGSTAARSFECRAEGDESRQILALPVSR